MPPPVDGARDFQLLTVIADLLIATEQFSEVSTGGLPEDAGGTAEVLKLAALQLDTFEEKLLWDSTTGPEYERTVPYTLTLAVRDADPVARDAELDRLAQVAGNTVNVSLAGVTFIPKSWLRRGRYERPVGVERRLTMSGQFVYQVSSGSTRNADP